MVLAADETAKVVQVVIPKDQSIWSVVHYAVMRSNGARHLNDSARRVIVESVLTALGQDSYGDDEFRYIGPDAELETAARRLLEFVPECGYSPNFGEFAIKDEDSRYYFGNGEDDEAAAAEYQNNTRDVPFLSQMIYYPVLGGKHDGRALNSRVHDLRTALGLEDS